MMNPADESLLSDKLLWRGYDFFSIANAAMSLREPRGEFESTEEYATKRAKLASQTIYGTVNLQSRLALVLPEIARYSNTSTLIGGAPLGYSFDADTRKLRVCWSGKEVISGQLGRAVESIVVNDTRSTEAVAQNAYGAKVNKTSIRGEQVTVAVPLGPNRCPIEIDVDGSSAQRLVRVGGAVVAGSLRSPFVEQDTDSRMATFSSPTEVFINVRRLLFVPEQIFLLDRETRTVLISRDLARP